MALQGVINLGVVGQTPGQAVGHIYQHAEVVADGGIVALDIDFAVHEAGSLAQGTVDHTGQLAITPVDGRAKTNGYTIIDLVAQGRLHGDDLHLAVLAVVTATEAFLVVADYAVGHVNAQAEVPVFVDRGGDKAERHGGGWHHVAFAGFSAGVADIDLGLDCRCASDDFCALELGQASRVASNGRGVQRGRGATSIGRTHAADALLIDGDSVSHAAGGNGAHGQGKGRFQPEIFH